MTTIQATLQRAGHQAMQAVPDGQGCFLGRRYVGTMKRGSPAAGTLRDAAGALWRKGACLTWRVPAGAAQQAAMTGACP